VIGKATGDVAARTLGVETRVILSDNGLGLLPKLDPQKSGWGDEAAFKGVFKIMTGVGDLIRQIDNLGFKERMASGAGERVESLPHLMGEIEAVEFRIFDFQLFDDAEALAVATEAAAILHKLVESLFYRTTERGMPEVAGEGDGFSQVLIECQGTAE
jgi:hypothetical protein